MPCFVSWTIEVLLDLWGVKYARSPRAFCPLHVIEPLDLAPEGAYGLILGRGGYLSLNREMG